MKVEEVGPRIHELWKTSGKRQKELLADMGIERQTFNAWVNNTNTIPLKRLEQFAKALGGELILDIHTEDSQRGVFVGDPEIVNLAKKLGELDPDDLALVARVVASVEAFQEPHRVAIEALALGATGRAARDGTG